MYDVLSLLVNAGFLGVLWFLFHDRRRAHEREVLWLNAQLREAQHELKVAQDRLLATWRDGGTVPPREITYREEDIPTQMYAAVSPEAEEWLSQWSDPDVRGRWDRWIRNRVRDGRTPAQAVADAELQLVHGRIAEPAEPAVTGRDYNAVPGDDDERDGTEW